MSDDLDALLARADRHRRGCESPRCIINDLAAAVRTLRGDNERLWDFFDAYAGKRQAVIDGSGPAYQVADHSFQAAREAVLAAAETRHQDQPS